MAHVVNGRDSQPKTLGVKRYAGENVNAGGIILKQRGTRFKAGVNVGLAKDYSLFALAAGRVHFSPAGLVSVISEKKK